MQHDCVALLCMLIDMPLLAQAEDAGQVLKARHLSLSKKLASNPFERPLYLESRQTRASLEGEIYALVEQPESVLSIAFAKAQSNGLTEVKPLFCASLDPVRQSIQRWILEILVPSMLTPAIRPC